MVEKSAVFAWYKLLTTAVSATWSTMRPVYSAFEFSRSAGCDALFLLSTKPF